MRAARFPMKSGASATRPSAMQSFTSAAPYGWRKLGKARRERGANTTRAER
jgi:hypothetical protein